MAKRESCHRYEIHGQTPLCCPTGRKLSTAKYADATVVSSAKEVLAAAKATLAKADAGQADLDAQAETVSALSTVVTESNTAGFDKKQATEKE